MPWKQACPANDAKGVPQQKIITPLLLARQFVGREVSVAFRHIEESERGHGSASARRDITFQYDLDFLLATAYKHDMYPEQISV